MNDKVEAIRTAGDKVVGKALIWIDENGLHIEAVQEDD